MTHLWKSTVSQITGPKLSSATNTALMWAGASKQSSRVIKRTYNTGNLERMPIPHKINPNDRKRIPRKPKKKDGSGKKGVDDGKDSGMGGRNSKRYSSAHSGSHSTADTDDETYYDTDLEDEEATYEHNLREKNVYFYACKKFDVIPSSYFMRNMDKADVIMNYQGIGDLGCAALCVPLLNNHTITTLDLAGNAISVEGLEYLLEMFRENIFVRDLSLAENPLGSKGAKIICEMMKINSQITKLDVSGCGFTEKDAVHFADLLQQTTILEHLIMRNNEFGDRGGAVLGPAIGANDSLQILDLSWNHLRLRGAEAVALSLQENTTLKTLNISWNGFSVDGSKAMGYALSVNKSVLELDMSSNRMNKDAVVNLLAGLRHNTTLNLLKLSRNPITVKGALHLFETVKDWTEMPLKRLELYNIQLDDREVVHAINEVQAVHPTLCIRQGSLSNDQSKSRVGRKKEDPLETLVNFVKARDLQMIDLFKQFDTDNSWSVSREEFKLGIKIAKIPLSDDQLTALMNQLDADRDGEIDFGELMKGQRELEAAHLASSKKESFAVP